MKSHIYTIKDEYLGIPLLIEGELVEWDNEREPDVIINEISYSHPDGTVHPVNFWAVSDRFISHLQDRIYQTWCQE